MEQYKVDTKKVSQDQNDNQLNLLRVIESRIVEIVQIEKDVKKKYPRLFQQRLPRFMRRRAASHNPFRIPKWLRTTKLKAKDRRKLYMYRRRIRFIKHKRILRRHARHRFKDPNKSLLHKWFAKRFKMDKKPQTGMEFVPLHNNTKNFRNLYRQTRYGCAYISMAHLIVFKINSPYNTRTIDTLNVFTRSVSGFTFAARALELGNYEIVVHLHDISRTNDDGDLSKRSAKKRCRYVCPALVHNHQTYWTLWVPRTEASRVVEMLERTGLPFHQVPPREYTRIRLVGPEARSEALKLASEPEQHEKFTDDLEKRLARSFQLGTTIGRFIEDKNVLFTYYQTDPVCVDVVFRNKREGRMTWYRLIKNKAHLVGGKRDVDELLMKQYGKIFQLKPDCD